MVIESDTNVVKGNEDVEPDELVAINTILYCIDVLIFVIEKIPSTPEELILILKLDGATGIIGFGGLVAIVKVADQLVANNPPENLKKIAFGYTEYFSVIVAALGRGGAIDDVIS